MSSSLSQALHRHLSRPLVFLHFILWSLYFVLLWTRQYFVTPDGISAGWIGSWADGAVHLTYASTFAYGPGIKGDHPLFAGHPFTYPFASDLLTGYLAKLGFPITVAHILLGFILSLSLLILLYLFYLRLFHRDSIAILASNLFFFSGGLGWYWFLRDLFSSGLSTLAHLPRQYTHYPEVGIEWINTISGLLIPQRALLLALPVGLFLFLLLWRIYRHPRQISFTLLLTGSLLLGLLPIIHPHTLFVVGLVTLFLARFAPRSSQSKLLLFLILASPLGLILAARFILPATGSGFFSWFPGWLSTSASISWFKFWILNWGLTLPIFTIAFFHLPPPLRRFTSPFILVFILANLIQFQPYAWDNVKIFIWVYLVFAGAIASLLINWFTRHSFLTSLLLLVLISSGLLDSLRLLDLSQNQIPMYSSEQLEIAHFLRTNTSATARFLTSDTHNHLVPTLTGRPILMGYPGWLWTYGIDYHSREQHIATIFAGTDPALDLLHQYAIDYVVIGPSEQHKYTPNQAFFTDHFSPILTTDNYTIYAIN